MAMGGAGAPGGDPRAPNFLREAGDDDAQVRPGGESINLHYEGRPAPTVSWRLHHSSTANPPNFMTASSNGHTWINIEDVEADVTLQYTVTLQNEAGTAEQQVVIIKRGANNSSWKKWVKIGALAAVVGVASIVATPLVLGVVGFTSVGVTAGSLAAKLMSLAAVANGGNIAAGSTIAILQSVGAAGLGAPGTAFVGGMGAGVGAAAMGGPNVNAQGAHDVGNPGGNRAPRFTEEERYDEQQVVRSGETLDIKYEGYPAPAVRWRLHDGGIENPPTIETNDITRVTRMRAGQNAGANIELHYTVTLENQAGAVQMEVRVTLTQ